MPSETPLQLSADTGLDATLKAALDSSVTLDDIAGITGNVWRLVHRPRHQSQDALAMTRDERAA